MPGCLAAGDQQHVAAPELPRLHFSPDSRRVAYAAEETVDRFLVVADAKEGDSAGGLRYDDILNGLVAFSPDGRHVAAVVSHGGKECVVLVDEQLG